MSTHKTDGPLDESGDCRTMLYWDRECLLRVIKTNVSYLGT